MQPLATFDSDLSHYVNVIHVSLNRSTSVSSVSVVG